MTKDRRVDAGNISIVDEYRRVCGRGGCKVEGALKIMSCRWVMNVDGVGGEVSADEGGRVHNRCALACIERRVMVVADVGGCRVSGWGFGRLSFARKVLSEGEASIVAKRQCMGSSSGL